MSLELASESVKKKSKGRTIREWLASRRPDFDPTQHQVVINDVNYENERLDLPLCPLDRVKIIPKGR